MFELHENSHGYSVKPQPLTNAELERLTTALELFGDKRRMNLEQLDGFLSSLICCPDIVSPSEYLPAIWGGDIVLEEGFAAQPILKDFLSLIMRHWNVIVDTLDSGDVYLPLLIEDKDGISHGNDWANGFMRGMELRKEQWSALVNDEKNGGSLIPIFTLAHENNPDPKMRPYKEPVSAELREKLIVGAAAGMNRIYHYFEPQRLHGMDPLGSVTTFRRTTPKVGRNELCPCGSGKKFKHCCGKTTLH
jgi:uncharacterized protein